MYVYTYMYVCIHTCVYIYIILRHLADADDDDSLPTPTVFYSSLTNLGDVPSPVDLMGQVTPLRYLFIWGAV